MPSPLGPAHPWWSVGAKGSQLLGGGPSRGLHTPRWLGHGAHVRPAGGTCPPPGHRFLSGAVGTSRASGGLPLPAAVGGIP